VTEPEAGGSAEVTKESVLEAAKELLAKGLVEGTSGNVSGRLGDGTVCLTPSSVPYETMTVEDLTVCDLDGTQLEGSRGPTSEKALHLACYRAHAEVGGVIHSHAVHATMFATVRQPIPAVIEEVVVYVGGDVPVADYRTTGTDELGDEIARHLGDRSAVLVANHGMVTIGATPAKALHAAGVVERTAQIVWGARMLGPVHPVPEEVNANFAGVYRMMREMGM
jgi:L-fuculose-phosphate aldolase